MNESHDVISAFLDDEPFDANELANALSEPGGRELLLDFIALRHIVHADGTAVDDAAITIEFSRAVTEPRLGVDPIEIPGAHSPFLARPGELSDLLDRLTF